MLFIPSPIADWTESSYSKPPVQPSTLWCFFEAARVKLPGNQRCHVFVVVVLPLSSYRICCIFSEISTDGFSFHHSLGYQKNEKKTTGEVSLETSIYPEWSGILVHLRVTYTPQLLHAIHHTHTEIILTLVVYIIIWSYENMKHSLQTVGHQKLNPKNMCSFNSSLKIQNSSLNTPLRNERMSPKKGPISKGERQILSSSPTNLII